MKRIELDDLPMRIREDMIDYASDLKEGIEFDYLLRIEEMDYQGDKTYFVHAKIGRLGCLGVLIRLNSDNQVCFPPQDGQHIERLRLALCDVAHGEFALENIVFVDDSKTKRGIRRAKRDK